MNFRRLSDNDLADFAASVASLLSGAQLAAIPAVQRTALAAAIGTLPDDLGLQIQQAGNAEAERMSANSLKNATREQLIRFMSQVRNALLAGLAPKTQYDLCGFDFREGAGSSYVAQNPTAFRRPAFSNGVNVLGFKGNNRLNAVV